MWPAIGPQNVHQEQNSLWRIDPALQGLRNLGKYGSFSAVLRRHAQQKRAALAAARGGPLEKRVQGLLRLLYTATADMHKQAIRKLVVCCCAPVLQFSIAWQLICEH